MGGDGSGVSAFPVLFQNFAFQIIAHRVGAIPTAPRNNPWPTRTLVSHFCDKRSIVPAWLYYIWRKFVDFGDILYCLCILNGSLANFSVSSSHLYCSLLPVRHSVVQRLLQIEKIERFHFFFTLFLWNTTLYPKILPRAEVAYSVRL